MKIAWNPEPPPDAAEWTRIIEDALSPVSYTHLTLPTNREV